MPFVEAKYTGKGVIQDHVEKAAGALLSDDESLLGVFSGHIVSEDGSSSDDNGESTSPDYMLVTDRRVIFWTLHCGPANSLSYDDIASVGEARGRVLGEITARICGSRARMERVPKDDVPVAAKLIRTQIAIHQAHRTEGLTYPRNAKNIQPDALTREYCEKSLGGEKPVVRRTEDSPEERGVGLPDSGGTDCRGTLEGETQGRKDLTGHGDIGSITRGDCESPAEQMSEKMPDAERKWMPACDETGPLRSLEREWMLVENDEETGPFTSSQVQQRYALHEVDGAVLCHPKVAEGPYRWRPLSFYFPWFRSESSTAEIGVGQGVGRVLALDGAYSEVPATSNPPLDHGRIGVARRIIVASLVVTTVILAVWQCNRTNTTNSSAESLSRMERSSSISFEAAHDS